ncbi:AP-1-like transcription factor [Xanthoria parietina]
MDYAHASYYPPPVQQYPYFDIPPPNEHSYPPHEGRITNPIDPNYDLNGFMAFEQSFNYAPQSMVPPPHSPSHSIRRSSIPQQLPRESSLDVQADFEIYEPGQGRSSDDERDNLTPAQSRRKAQNRAAQRAFRERKERHVKDLEGKLNNITSQNNSLLAEIERLRRENEKFATQNEILQATATPLSMNHNRPGFNGHVTHPASPAAGPMHFSPMTSHHVVSSPRERIVSPSPHRIDFLPSTGERVYGTGATWDFIQNHELFRQGIVDIALVSQRLQQHAICDGGGPAFAESAIIRAIEDSIGGAADELM